MSAIRAIPRVGSATTSALRAMDSLHLGSTARVAGAAASQVGSSGVGNQGARVQSPSVQFSAVMQAQGAGSSTDGGMDLDRAMALYVEARTLECQEQLAAQKSGETKRQTNELRERVEAALDGGSSQPVRARPRMLPPHQDALPAHALLLTDG